MLEYIYKKNRIWTQITCYYVNNNLEFSFPVVLGSNHVCSNYIVVNIMITKGLYSH